MSFKPARTLGCSQQRNEICERLAIASEGRFIDLSIYAVNVVGADLDARQGLAFVALRAHRRESTTPCS